MCKVNKAVHRVISTTARCTDAKIHVYVLHVQIKTLQKCGTRPAANKKLGAIPMQTGLPEKLLKKR